MSSLSELAEKAFVAGYPLVYNITALQEISAKGSGDLPGAPFNEFAFARVLANPKAPFVSVNCDTLYVMAQLDLSGGPLELTVPDTDGRYYVLQFVDAWTNNFAYVGRRATGTEAGRYLLCPPGWDGDNPDGLPVITAPTAIATIVGRVACAGPDDLEAAIAAEDGFRLSPLPGAGPLQGIPTPNMDLSEPLRFWDSVRLWSQAFPPSAADIERLEAFRELGIRDTDAPYERATPELATALAQGLVAGRARIDAMAMSTESSAPGGWESGLHMFDYNREFFEIGTIDDDAWKIADPDEAELMRAFAARAGLWGNHAYEALYPMTFLDADGEPLNGEHRYEITFPERPPVDAFWSMTMYSLPEFYLVENPINRYAIGDNTPGLVYAEDGSLTLTLQTDEPSDPAARANWLPTPPGQFRPAVRLYQPRPEVLDGTYVLPSIRRVD